MTDQLVEGTKDEIVKALHDASTRWANAGKDLLAFEARSAAGKIMHGEVSVQVGRLKYVVRRADG